MADTLKNLKNVFQNQKIIADVGKSFEDNVKLLEKMGVKVKRSGDLVKNTKNHLEKELKYKSDEIKYEEAKLEFLKKNEKQWHEHRTISKRLSNLITGGLKEKFNDSAVGKTFAFAKNILVGSKNSVEKLKDDSEKIQKALDVQEAGEEMARGRKVLTKAKDYARKGTSPEVKEQQKQTKLLADINKKQGKSSGGILSFVAGLALLVGAGGLLGFLMTGKKEFLYSLVKGIVKFAQLSGKGISKVFGKLPKIITKPLSKIGKLIVKPLTFLGKNIGKMFGNVFGKIGAKGIVKFAQLSGKGISKVFGKLPKIITKPLSKIGKLIVKPLTFLGKNIGKMFGNVFGKIGAKGLGKALSKGGKVGLKILKKIPGIGALLGLAFGIMRFRDGDIIGGLLEIGSGIASIFPGVGTAISVAIDAAILFRDFKNLTGTSDVPMEVNEGPSILSKFFDGVKLVVSKIGDFFKFLFKWSAIGIVIRVVKNFDTIKEKLTGVLSKVTDLMDPIIDWVGALVGKVKGFISNLFGGLGNFFEDMFIEALDTTVLGTLMEKFLGKETLAKFRESQEEKKERERIANLKRMSKELTPDKHKTIGGKTIMVPPHAMEGRLILPGAEQGAIIARPTKLVVGEKRPEAIIPLHKIDDVFREMTNEGSIEIKTPVATSPSQTGPVQADRDVTGEHLEDLKKFLIDAFIPELANNLNKQQALLQGQPSIPVSNF